jgi:hypothetical protein
MTQVPTLNVPIVYFATLAYDDGTSDLSESNRIRKNVPLKTDI